MTGFRVTTHRYAFQLVREPEPAYPLGSTVATPREAVAIATHVLGGEITECVIAIFLNARNAICGYAEIARGTLNATRFQPRDISFQRCTPTPPDSSSATTTRVATRRRLVRIVR